MAHKNKKNVSAGLKNQQKASAYLRKSSNGSRERHRSLEQIENVQQINDRLYDIFANHGAKDWISHEQRLKLAHYYQCLSRGQAEVNMTRLFSFRDIAIKHFLDSLLVTQLTQLQFPLLDLGTGAGLPGIPLKIYYPHEKILLAEGVQKRVEFLKNTRDTLGFPDLGVFGRNINSYFYYPVNGVITRAVEDIGNTLSNVLGCLRQGGRVYFMKGPGVDLEFQTFSPFLQTQYRKIDDISYEIPKTNQKRRLIIFERQGLCPLSAPEDEPWPEDL